MIENFMVCSTLGDMSYFSYTKKNKNSKKLKVEQFSLFWVKSFRGTHECENQKTNSAFVIYWRAFTENIHNSRKVFFPKKTSQTGFVEFELRNYRSYSQTPKCDMQK